MAWGKTFLQSGIAFFKNNANGRNGFLFLWLALAASLFFLPEFSLTHNPAVLLGGLVVLFAFWELSVPQWPRLFPEIAAFVPLLFLGTPLWILPALLALAILTRIIYVSPAEKSDFGELLRFIQWGLLLVFSYEFFVRLGLRNNVTVFQPQSGLVWLAGLGHFFGILLLWVFLFTALHFLLVHVETLFRRRRISVPPDWKDLGFSCLANFLFVIFGFLFFAASGLTPVWFFYEVTIFSLVLFAGQKIIRNYGLRREATFTTMEVLAQLPRRKAALLSQTEEKVSSSSGEIRFLQLLVGLARVIAESYPVSGRQVEALERAAPVTEIGLIGVSDPQLEEWIAGEPAGGAKLRETTQLNLQYTEEILGRLSQYREDALPFLLSRYERWDGSGFPKSLRENKIPVGAQILAVAEFIVRSRLSPDEAVQEVRKRSGMEFSPKIVDAVVRAYEKGLIQQVGAEPLLDFYQKGGVS